MLQYNHKDSESQINLFTAIHLREVLRYIAEVSQLELTIAGEYLAITTSNETTGFNYIVGIGEKAADFVPLIEQFKQHNQPFIWFSYPLTPMLERFLTQHGLAQVAPLACVACDLTQEPTPVKVGSSFELIPVTTSEHFLIWCQIIATTWNRSLDLASRFYQGLNPELNPQSRIQLFLVRNNPHYVGCSLLDIQGNIAGCYWDCVLPEYRQQGVGRMMIEQRKAIAKAQGCSHIVAQCVYSSLGGYLKAGFQKGASMALYRLQLT